MKLSPNEFKRFKSLTNLAQDGKLKAGSKEELELAKLAAKKGGKGRVSAPGDNDIAWYQKYPELLRDSANIIFNEVAGTEFKCSPISPVDNIKWPTVGARFVIFPTIGRALTEEDPYNYQMRSLWLALHRAYRGIGTYEYADLGISIFCIINVFAELARAERIYGVCSNFKARNRSMPDVLLQALDVDPISIDAAGLADFRYRLNRIIAKATLLCLPKGFAAFDDFVTIMGSVFKDSEDIRAQWFVYDSPCYIKYNPTKFTTGGCAEYVQRATNSGGGMQTLVDITNDLNAQINALLSDTDVARMCSDILKAFGDNGIEKLLYVPEDYVVEPVVNETRKIQLHNTVFVGDPIGSRFSNAMVAESGFTGSYNTDFCFIYQEGGVIKQCLGSCGTVYTGIRTAAASDFKAFDTDMNSYGFTSNPIDYYLGDPMLDSWKQEVTPDDVVEMTRQTVSFDKFSKNIGGTTYYSIEINGYSVYVVCSMTLYSMGTGGVINMAGTNIHTYSNISTAVTQSSMIGSLSRIDWHPWIDLCYAPSGVPGVSSIFWDIDNYSLISREALSRIHDACTLSLFKLENMGLVKE